MNDDGLADPGSVADPRGQEIWTEVEWVVLEPVDRSAGAPEDTRAQRYVARCRGLAADPVMGETARIRTPSGRTLQGRVVDVNPGYHHGFGRPLPEWTRMRQGLRELIDGDQARTAEDPEP